MLGLGQSVLFTKILFLVDLYWGGGGGGRQLSLWDDRDIL